MAVILYVCASGTIGPGALHPCAKAARALDGAGHRYETRRLKTNRAMFWTWGSRSRDRAEVKRLSGQESVPILVLDDGSVVTGSGEIAAWARAHPHAG
ncbi:MAG: hypothetical protein M0T77_11260 [Actinomycetota bacterium]|nr:hypothetical protein [Actinomycetota bacterium]